MTNASIDYFDFLLSEVTEDNAPFYDIRARQCMDVYKRFKAGEKPGRVLDIGSGAGVLVNKLRKNYQVDALGMEAAAKGVQHAVAQYGDFYWHHALGEAVSEADLQRYGHQDMVTCFEVFQMFPYFEFRKYAEAAATFLKKGGIFLLMVPNCGHPYLFPYLAYSDPFTQTFFTPESLYRANYGGGLRLLKIMRWNTASKEYMVSVRNTLQVIGEKALTMLTPALFSVPRKLNRDIHEADIFLSSHMAAIFIKD